ncbi:MAG TPA: valine--tRNA ligase [Anaerolineales bacterium]|nr:valine--tRNA ligase [Anaerolineales bacterium]
MNKTYDFKATEARLYAWWEANGYFRPNDGDGEPFVIAIPPPNVTGALHLGHAMFASLEDLMVRYHRMLGHPTLWIPGTDHAGIATQLQVEKMLVKEGTSREAVGRAEFLRRTWQWKEKYGSEITTQLRRLGSSADWERERFTMDEGLSLAVTTAFVRLYEKGLIYRGPRLINWSPGLKTAVSDLEVEYSEEQGSLYYFKYRIKDSTDFIPVATTRPETILADTAVCVHPDDPRYQHLIGKTARVPILEREVPVIADTYVDREFGTGALKITPGHDFNDYQIGQRHNLAMISMLDRSAKVTEVGGKYSGMDRFDCRTALWADMTAAGLTIKVEPHTLKVPRSQRGGEIVEPMMSTQWFLRMESLAKPAIAAVRNGDLRIVPERFEKIWYNWLENIQDWCVSRQLWWGHQIPVWYAPDGSFYCATSEESAQAQARAALGQDVPLTRDPDVLDTWFSSGLWPFSTLGWPQQTPDLARFYPNSVLETGYDILFFWVARMVMMGLEFTGKLPFHTIYLHGLVRDEQGRKMSKTTGNVIDPLVVIDEFGTDSLRFTLLTGGTPGNDLNLSLEKVKANRNFANKIWNATRFVIGKLTPQADTPPPSQPNIATQWIAGRLQKTIADVTRNLNAYQFGQAGLTAYDFIWGDFADWYIEIAKPLLSDPSQQANTTRQLVGTLDLALRLLHPFVPFVTEEIWQNLRQAAIENNLPPGQGTQWADALIAAEWPHSEPLSPQVESAVNEFAHLQEMITALRRARAENNLPAADALPAVLVAATPQRAALFQAESALLGSLARLDANRLQVLIAPAPAVPNAIAMVVGTSEIYLPQAQVDNAAERERLEKELENAIVQIDRLSKLLNSPFAQKAPPQVVAGEQAKLAEWQGVVMKLRERLQS